MYPREKFCEKCGTELNITSVYDLFARYDVKTGKKYREYQILRRCPQRRFWGMGIQIELILRLPPVVHFGM